MSVIAVIGLGYVGLPLVVEFGKHFRTIGFDIAVNKVESCRRLGGNPSHSTEPRLMPDPTPGNLYADLSGYYDGFCHEVDYAEQGDFLRRAFDCLAESTGRDYLDLACGTGQLLQQMHQHGFAVAGLDNSPQMLEATARRCPSAALMLCDLASFDEPGRFDLISCFLYSIHYSHPVAALTDFWQANRALIEARLKAAGGSQP